MTGESVKQAGEIKSKSSAILLWEGLVGDLD